MGPPNIALSCEGLRGGGTKCLHPWALVSLNALFGGAFKNGPLRRALPL
jgi:hypothetical protein